MICIDPGHGGRDAGAVAGGVFEKDLCLVYALTLAGECARLGIPVTMTRERDEMPGGGTAGDGLRYRSLYANRMDARAFVSIHMNASANDGARGLWLLYAKGAKGGQSLAETMQRRLGGLVYPDDSPWTGGRKLAVLRETRMPAVIVECGFITHRAEREELEHIWRLREFVASAALGIQDWLTKGSP
jgi:N-acetylmuramoyl-L-alanine amidase